MLWTTLCIQRWEVIFLIWWPCRLWITRCFVVDLKVIIWSSFQCGALNTSVYDDFHLILMLIQNKVSLLRIEPAGKGVMIFYQLNEQNHIEDCKQFVEGNCMMLILNCSSYATVVILDEECWSVRMITNLKRWFCFYSECDTKYTVAAVTKEEYTKPKSRFDYIKRETYAQMLS
jgi:hypothetical protein